MDNTTDSKWKSLQEAFGGTKDAAKYQKLLEQYDRHCAWVVKSTIVDVLETREAKARRIANLEKDYITWFEYYFAHYAKKKSAKFHKKLAKLITGNRKIRCLAEIYRSGAKSVHIDMGIPLYLYFVMKELRFMLLIGQTEPKAQKLLSDIQSELQGNQRLRNDYGDRVKQGDWSDGNFYTTDGARFMAIGFGQSPRGLREGHQRPDYIAIDDVDSKKHVNNNDIMREAVEFITEEVEGCFDADSSEDAIERLIYANNNFHKNSVTNRLKEEFKKNVDLDKKEGIDSDYKIFSVPAVKDMIDFEPTWPEKTTAAYWRKKYQRNARAFKREYMHIHVAEGKIFLAEYFQHKKMLPLGEYDSLVFIGDLSYKDKADFKGLFLVGKKGKEYHIIFCFLRQTSRRVAAEWLYDMYEKHNLSAYNISYKFDGLFAQDQFEDDFDAEGEERGYYIPVVANVKSYGNKFDHIESALGKFIRKWVWWNIEEKGDYDQTTCIEQFMEFEKGSGTHDDGPDAVVVGMKLLDQETFQEKFAARIAKRRRRNPEEEDREFGRGRKNRF